MPINRTSLLSKLSTLLSTDITLGSTFVENVLTSSLSTEVLGDVNIITVANTDSLPNLRYHNSPSGMICYIENLDVFAISSNSKWITLDGKLLRQDSLFGALYSWGNNSSGSLGDNTVVNKSSPILVPNSFTDWCHVSGAGQHVIALRQNGTIWSWGCNGNGRIGDGTVANKSSPVSVVGGFTDWCQVSAGGSHSLGIRTNGTAWAWGTNTIGQLGDGTVANKSSPVSVVGGFTDWSQISGGGEFSIGVRTNGTAWAWGCNGHGQLGDSTTLSKSSPVAVAGGFTDWCQISAGTNHSMAVRTNGTAWTWGYGACGILGDNATISRSSPVSVVGGFTDWCQVSAGVFHSLGIRTNGTAWAWGCNGNGQLGNGTITNRSSPVSVIGGFTNWCQINGGITHSTGVRSDGTAWAWGGGSLGVLGDNTVNDKSSPVSIAGGFTNWSKVSGKSPNLGVVIIC